MLIMPFRSPTVYAIYYERGPPQPGLGQVDLLRRLARVGNRVHSKVNELQSQKWGQSAKPRRLTPTCDPHNEPFPPLRPPFAPLFGAFGIESERLKRRTFLRCELQRRAGERRATT